MSVKVICLASGEGSNFEALAEYAPQIGVEILELLTDNPRAGVIARAKKRGVPVSIFEKKSGVQKKTYFEGLLKHIQALNPQWVCLAGFMKLLPPSFIKEFENRILNIHPSLLPSFPGIGAIEQAFVHGVKVTGCTVHFVTEKMDDGPILIQKALEVFETETLSSLTTRMHELEHQCYREALKLVMSDAFEIEGRKIKTHTRVLR